MHVLMTASSSCGVDDACRVALKVSADRGDSPIADGDVCAERGRARPVDNVPAADDEIELGHESGCKVSGAPAHRQRVAQAMALAVEGRVIASESVGANSSP